MTETQICLAESLGATKIAAAIQELRGNTCKGEAR